MKGELDSFFLGLSSTGYIYNEGTGETPRTKGRRDHMQRGVENTLLRWMTREVNR